jgi:hypothetical protein
VSAPVKSGGGRPSAYRAKDGKRVSGVTTIISRFKDSGGLIHWAWQQGMDGNDYRKTRDNAAGAGSLAHELIDSDIHGRPAELPTTDDLSMSEEDYEKAMELAMKAHDSFVRWRAQVNLEIIETETPLISEEHRFGGTFDGLARILGKVHLIDWKTSNKVYPDYLAQLGGYDVLIEECRGIRVEGAQLLRFGKEWADFHAHSWPREVVDHGRRAFLLMKELFEVDAILKRAAA